METELQKKSSVLTDVGGAIRKYRLAADLSQADLSQKTGISVKFISEVEQGKKNVSVISLVKIAEALNITILDLFYISYRSNRRTLKNEIDTLLNDFSEKELEAVRNILNEFIRSHPDL